MRLYLVRHGQSYVNLPDWSGDNWNQPLTPLGEQQAQLVAAWIKENINARHIYASTVTRAAQTAEYIDQKLALGIQFDDRIREIGMNAPDGSALPDEKLTRYMEDIWGSLKPYDPITERGETWMQFRQRVGSFIESLQRSFPNHLPDSPEALAEQTALVVCHGGVIEAIFEYVFQKGPWSVVWVSSNNTGITCLEYRPIPLRPEWRLYYHNQCAHLAPDLIT